MNSFTRSFLIIGGLVIVLVVGGVVFLGTWDIPPPTAKIEKVIPNDRLPR